MPFSTKASFQARLKASWIEVLEPSPFDGGWRWVASPMQKTRPFDMVVAYMLLTVQVETDLMVDLELGIADEIAHDLLGDVPRPPTGAGWLMS